MKKIVYIDMDGVVADFNGFINPHLPEKYRNRLDELTDEEQKEVSDIVDDIMYRYPYIFEQLDLIEDAYDSVMYLKDNFDVYFLSTPVHKLPESYTSKRIWIKNNFGDWADKRLILTHRKDLCIGDYLIDDRLKNGSEKFKGIHLHFGKVSPFYGSLINWKDVIGVIKRREMI